MSVNQRMEMMVRLDVALKVVRMQRMAGGCHIPVVLARPRGLSRQPCCECFLPAHTTVSPPDKVTLLRALALSWSIPYPVSEVSQGCVTLPPALRGDRAASLPTLGEVCVQLLASPGR